MIALSNDHGVGQVRSILRSMLLVVFVLLLSCVGTSEERTIKTEEGEPSLKDLAYARNIWIGTAVGARMLRQDPIYRETLSRQFNMVTTENAMKFSRIHPVQNRYAFENADTIVDFAVEHDMQVRGHTLVWHRQLPRWLTECEWTRAELNDLLRDHIMSVVGRYRGRVRYWDVVNEAVEGDGSYRKSIWFKTIGPSYIEQSFRWAHEADPDAKLFYNDFQAEGLGTKSDAVYELVADLKARGVPIHGVGLQMHIDVPGMPDSEDLRANIQRLAELDLEIHITEIDVRLPQPADARDFADQARVYENVLSTALESPRFKAFVLWGFTDRYSWIPRFFPGTGTALIFDVDYQSKPAYYALKNALEM